MKINISVKKICGSLWNGFVDSAPNLISNTGEGRAQRSGNGIFAGTP